MKKINSVLIIGATSSIANEVARLYAVQKCDLTLLARNEEKLKEIKSDLTARGAKSVKCLSGNLASKKTIEELFTKATASGSYDLVLIAYGVLCEQEKMEQKPELIADVINTNFTSVTLWCEKTVNFLNEKNNGCLAVIGSVAGDRGRKKNYVYGSTKAALDSYLQGLTQRFDDTGVHILTIKPGFIDTPMTDKFDKGGPLWAKPEDVAQDIVKAIDKNKRVIYTPWFWFFIMFVIKQLPYFIFKRLPI